MADKKISQLSGATTPLTGTEELAIVQGGSTVKATAQDIADLGGGGTLPIVNTYPVTTPSSAGTRFWYKGNEWHYMTQDEIDSIGWTAIVSVGFPAPVSKGFNPSIIYNDFLHNDSSIGWGGGNTLDFLGYGNPSIIRTFIGASPNSGIRNITTFRNANFLISLKDLGTAQALGLSNSNMSALTINSLFTQLPITIETATINVSGNPGAATCNPTIATGKGYTVVV